MKTCKDCKIPKSLDDYYISKKAIDGKRGMCKECDKKRKREWDAKNPEKKKLYYRNKVLRIAQNKPNEKLLEMQAAKD